MRAIMIAAVLAATFASSSAFAQGTYQHHTFCLKSNNGGQECAYDSMAQCEAARAGTTTGSCIQNSQPLNH